MLKIALQRMQSIFSAQALQVAETLFKSSGVLRVRLHDGLVKAEVRGDKHFVYGVHFDLKSWPAVAAKCTCGTKHPCVHVAASLLALAVRDTPLSEMNSYSLTKVTTPLRVNLGAAEWYSTLESSDLGLFSYELGIDIQGKKISMLPVLAYCAKCYGPQILDFPDTKLIVCPLPDGTQIEIPLGRIKPLLQFLQEYALRMSSDLDRWELASYDLLKVQALEVELPEIKVRWHTENQIRTRLLAFLSGKSDEKIALPPGVNVQLRDYQWQGVAWLQNLRILQLGGILADDMGLGKTVQVLIHLAIEKTQNRLLKPVLIVAPTSLVRNWQLEAARFTPALRVLVHHGNDRSFEHFDEYDVIVTTYTLVQRDKKHLLQTQFTYLILDEAQYIKNARNKRTQCLQELVVRHRLCLTGTPLENHLEELWSLFHFLMPGFLGDRAYFRKNFRHPIEKEKDIDTQLTLMRRIQPFMLRRTKDAVLQELPEKTEIVQMIHLEGVQRDLYEAIRISMVQKIHKIIQEKGF
ncbi:MAG: SNF2-related protein, partial [Legionellaceae bacterium]|nr:SNF2-related protein [Legionellaceae bacterium]